SRHGLLHGTHDRLLLRLAAALPARTLSHQCAGDRPGFRLQLRPHPRRHRRLADRQAHGVRLPDCLFDHQLHLRGGHDCHLVRPGDQGQAVTGVSATWRARRVAFGSPLNEAAFRWKGALVMRRVLILCAIFVFAGGAGLSAGDKKIRILLIGKDRDHAFGTHEYMSECELLAKCLKQTGGIDTVVSNGWPKETPRDIKAIVLYTARGGNVLFHGPAKKDVDELLKGGAGLTAIHWSTDADDKIGDLWLNTLGGWFNPKFSKLNTRVAHL